ncbi:MAG TPA: glycosyltransferase [Noviherbaspirillum sp.]
MDSALIVFSHLRWDFVFQRPQQLLSRLAAQRQIIFIEEPVHHPGAAFLRTYSPLPNVLVCQPHTPVAQPGFHDDHLPHLQELVRKLKRDYPQHIAWLYTPMALPLLQELDAQLVVYDCMDELSAFRHAPRQVAQREHALLRLADLVLTGGPSLYRARRERHPNVHCFPSSVQPRDFVLALDRTFSHPLHRDIPGPRLGYFGAIDERIDLDLLRDVADAHPRWQIVLVGPVIKIDHATLPQRPNIHYLGMQPYADLPRFLAGWDVCLLPFAISPATRYTNPTKTLEYLAAELPVVSTPVPDVVELYGEVVSIASGATAFVAACEQALLAGPEERAAQVERMREVVARNSWDETAAQVQALLRSTPRRESVPPLIEGQQVEDLPESLPQIGTHHHGQHETGTTFMPPLVEARGSAAVCEEDESTSTGLVAAAATGGGSGLGH